MCYTCRAKFRNCPFSTLIPPKKIFSPSAKREGGGRIAGIKLAILGWEELLAAVTSSTLLHFGSVRTSSALLSASVATAILEWGVGRIARYGDGGRIARCARDPLGGGLYLNQTGSSLGGTCLFLCCPPPVSKLPSVDDIKKQVAKRNLPV